MFQMNNETADDDEGVDVNEWYKLLFSFPLTRH